MEILKKYNIVKGNESKKLPLKCGDMSNIVLFFYTIYRHIMWTYDGTK